MVESEGIGARLSESWRLVSLESASPDGKFKSDSTGALVGSFERGQLSVQVMEAEPAATTHAGLMSTVLPRAATEATFW